jgi:hypothetical protein
MPPCPVVTILVQVPRYAHDNGLALSRLRGHPARQSQAHAPAPPASSSTTSPTSTLRYLLEGLARVKLGDANRTAELRQRHLAVIIDGLRSTQPTPLPGAPPTWQEQTERWITR